MSEIIKFPSASNTSKLSACPATKVPRATDWIYQDFFNTMLINGGKSDSIQMAPAAPVQINGSYTSQNYLLEQKSPYQNYLSYTSFSEALHVIAEPHGLNHDWDNNVDYDFCCTSTDDQVSLPDLLDNTKSGDEEEEDEEDMDDEQEEQGSIGSPFDFSQLVKVAPVLIESSISSCTTSTDDTMSFREENTTIETMVAPPPSSTIDQAAVLKKRKSNSSISSLKTFMNVFNTISHKKSKLNHFHIDTEATSTAAATKTPSNNNKNSSVSSTLSKKLLKYFKRRS